MSTRVRKTEAVSARTSFDVEVQKEADEFRRELDEARGRRLRRLSQEPGKFVKVKVTFEGKK